MTRESEEDEDNEAYIESIENWSDPLQWNTWIDGLARSLREKASGLIKLFDEDPSLRRRFAWYVYDSVKAVQEGTESTADQRMVYYVWNELGHMVDVSCFKP